MGTFSKGGAYIKKEKKCAECVMEWKRGRKGEYMQKKNVRVDVGIGKKMNAYETHKKTLTVLCCETRCIGFVTF